MWNPVSVSPLSGKHACVGVNVFESGSSSRSSKSPADSGHYIVFLGKTLLLQVFAKYTHPGVQIGNKYLNEFLQ